MTLWRPGESEAWRWRWQKAISFAWCCCGPRLFGRKSTEMITQDVAGSVCPAHLAANGFGKRTAETPNCWSKPLPFPSLVRDLWAILKAMLLSECFCYFAHKVVTATPHWPWGHYVPFKRSFIFYINFYMLSSFSELQHYLDIMKMSWNVQHFHKTSLFCSFNQKCPLFTIEFIFLSYNGFKLL